MYDFLLTNNSNYGPISYRFGDTGTYRSRIAEFAYTPVGFNGSAKGAKEHRTNFSMTLHMRFDYPISVQSFVPIHWPVFLYTC